VKEGLRMGMVHLPHRVGMGKLELVTWVNQSFKFFSSLLVPFNDPVF